MSVYDTLNPSLFLEMAQSRESCSNSYVLQFQKCKLAAELIGKDVVCST